MTPAQEKLLTLADRLIDRTRAGQVDWHFTGDGDAFVFSGSDAAVMVRSEHGEGSEPYELVLLNRYGTRIDGLRTEYLKGDGPAPVEAPWNAHLRDLHRAVRDSVLNLGKAVDSLLRDLDRQPEELGGTI